MKSICIFADFYEPGYRAGGPIRSISGLVNYLKYDFKVYIVTRDRDFGDLDSYDSILVDQWTEKSKNVSVLYLSPNFSVKSIIDLLDFKFDWIYLNSFFSPRFSVLPLILWKFRKIQSSNLIIAPRGEFNPNLLKIKRLKKYLFIKFMVFLSIYNKVSFHATSMIEYNDIIALFPNSKRYLISRNLTKIFNPKIPLKKYKGAVDIIYVSRILPNKNLEGVMQILAKVISRDYLKLKIIGPIECKSYFDSCIKIAKKNSLNFEYLGDLAHELVVKEFTRSHCFLFPTYGENYGHVISESIQAGCIPIISDQTPWLDLDNYNVGRVHSLDDLDSFALSIDEMMDMTNEEFQFMRNACYQYSEEKINRKEDIDAYINYFNDTRENFISETK